MTETRPEYQTEEPAPPEPQPAPGLTGQQEVAVSDLVAIRLSMTGLVTITFATETGEHLALQLTRPQADLLRAALPVPLVSGDQPARRRRG